MIAGDSTISTIGKLMHGRTSSTRRQDASRRIVFQVQAGPGEDSSGRPYGRERDKPMITPAFIFTVFMLTLGPIKTVPAFFAMIEGMAPEAVRVLAIKGTMAATAVSLLIALVMTSLAASWRVSADDMRIAGGILLFAASRETIGQFNRPASPLGSRPNIRQSRRLPFRSLSRPGASPRF